MEVRKGVLRIINDRGDVFALGDYSTGLKPDGSGKLVAKAISGDVVTWEFAAGQGPRADQNDNERNDMCLAVSASLSARRRLSKRPNATFP